MIYTPLPLWPFMVPFVCLFMAFSVILALILFGTQLDFAKNIQASILNLSMVSLVPLAFSLEIIRRTSMSVHMFDGAMIFSSTNSLVLLIILMLMILVLAFSRNYFVYERITVLEYPLLLILAFLGSMIVLLSNDLFMLYLGIEIQSFCFYILVALKRYSNISLEACLKYFILGSYASSVFIFGASFIYGMLGSTNYSHIALLLDSYVQIHGLSPFIIFGIIFVFVGLLFKLGLAPFHFWIADVYEGSPTIVVAFLAIVSKIAFFLAFVKIYYSVFGGFSTTVFGDLLMFFSLLSVLIGGLMGMYETKIKRLLAYSSVSHTGFMLLAITCSNFISLEAFYFYLFLYVLSLVNLFYILLSIRISSHYFEVKYLVDFLVLHKSSPMIGLSLSILFLSMAGVPPLPGFFAKALVFRSLIDSGNLYVAVILILFSIVNVIYYLRLVRFLFFAPTDRCTAFMEFNGTGLISNSLIAFHLLFLLFLPLIYQGVHYFTQLFYLA